jgi:hypothetical protein
MTKMHVKRKNVKDYCNGNKCSTCFQPPFLMFTFDIIIVFPQAMLNLCKGYITNLQYHEISIETVRKLKKVCMCNIHGLQSVKWHKRYTYYFYINDMSFLIVMF